jgi:hypothetical protein
MRGASRRHTWCNISSSREGLLSVLKSGKRLLPIGRRPRRTLLGTATVIADCRRTEIAAFHKQWGTYKSNPLVVEQGMTIEEAKRADPFGKGGGLLDGELVHEFPTPRRADHRDAA